MKAALDPVIDFEAMLIPDSWQQVSLVAPALAVEDIITNACDKKDLERIQKTTGKDKLKTVTLLGPSTWSSPKGTSGDPQLIERGGKYVLCSVYVEAFYESERSPRDQGLRHRLPRGAQGRVHHPARRGGLRHGRDGAQHHREEARPTRARASARCCST